MDFLFAKSDLLVDAIIKEIVERKITMRVLILTNSDIGLYKFRRELLEKFAKNGFEVFASLPVGEFTQQIKDLGCNYIVTEMNRRGKNPLQELSVITDYFKIIKDIDPDIILTYTIKSNVYGGLASRYSHVPYISNITGLGSYFEKENLFQRFIRILYKTALGKADKIFFQNQANLDYMLKDRIIRSDCDYELIPGSGVNLDFFRYYEYPDDEMINFVFVGRMMKEKGFGLYLDTAEYIHAKYPNTLFHICGLQEEDYEERVNDLVARGVCSYHYSVDDMRPIYGMIHCIIHPTYYPEGMSNVLLEACSCGRPVITTDRPGCKEIVDDNVNGFVVKQKDLDDLIEKVEKFVLLDNSQRAEMGRNARKKVEEQFDRRIVVNKYMEAIRKYGKKS